MHDKEELYKPLNCKTYSKNAKKNLDFHSTSHYLEMVLHRSLLPSTCTSQVHGMKQSANAQEVSSQRLPIYDSSHKDSTTNDK